MSIPFSPSSLLHPKTHFPFQDSYPNYAHKFSFKPASNYLNLQLSGTQFCQKSDYRRGVIRCATIDEIETEKSSTEKDIEERMEKTIESVNTNFKSIRTGRSNSSILDRIQIVGGRSPGLYSNETLKIGKTLEEFDWVNLENSLHYWTTPLRPVQWYPGHIAKTEKELKEQLKLMDVVIEVRDARIPMSTSHPMMDSWLGNRKRILVLNREDMITTADRNAWATYYASQGIKVVFSNGQLGMGALKLIRLAKEVAGSVNIKRKERGLLPRAVRAGIVGYPNVGKSSLINRLMKRRMCEAAPRPGVTRHLKWVRFGTDLELLDSPGILPMRISDQSAAIKLAICDDIGERSYDVSDVASILVQMLTRLPTVGSKVLASRYKIETDGYCGRTFVKKVAIQLFNGDTHQAAFRILSDFRKGKFGWVCLERPPK